MSGLPTVRVLLDDGSGTYPTDVTAKVELNAGITISEFGRTDEFAQGQAAQMSLAFDNTDGTFTTGADILSPDQGIRLEQTYPATANVNLLAAASADLEGGTVASWTAGGTVPPTLSNSTTRAYSGTHSLLVTWGTGGTLPLASLAVTGLTIGQTYTWSAYVYVPASNPNVTLAVGGGIGFGTSTGGVTGQWLRLTKTAVATATSHALQLVGSSPTSGQTAYIDAAMVNVGSAAGEFNTLAQTVTNRFTGKIESVELSWPGGSDKFAQVDVTAFDPLADAARKTLRSLVVQEILAAGVVAYHPLSEAAGASAAGDLSGNQTPLLPVKYSDAQAITFGADLGLVDGSTGVTFTNLPLLANAPELDKDGQAFGGAATWTDSSLFLTFVFQQNGFTSTSGSPVAVISRASGTGSSGVVFDSTGHALFNGCTSPTSLFDGKTHVISVQAGASATSDLWVDGVKVATDVVATGTWSNAHVIVGGQVEPNAVTSFAHFAYGPRTTDAQVLKVHQAIMSGFAGDTPATRFGRICSYLGLPSATTTGMSGESMPQQLTNGQHGLDALQVVAEAEGGVLFCNGDGTIVLQGRYYRGSKTTADLALPTPDDIDGGTTITFDTQQKFDFVTVTRDGGATQTTGNPAALYPTTLDLEVSTDRQALAAAQWLLLKHADPGKRAGSIKFNMFDYTTGLPQLEVGDRVSTAGMPTQQWADVGDVTVEGWTEFLSDQEWSLTVNVLPWTLFEEFILDDATYGVLDSDTPICY